jgi:hypothetical protein
MWNGLVEKFNGTLKHMLKRMCSERPKDWDKYINPLLFAYREVPQENLGFAPFDLLYVHSVRGPMAILKELWTKEIPDEDIKPTYQYVLDLRERLRETCKIAHEHLEKARKHQHKYYSRKLHQREKAYAVIEKKYLAVVWGIKKFHQYLYGKEFLLETDHQPLIFLNKVKTENSRLMRWALQLQPYRFRMIAIKGSENFGADYLSRQ